MGTGAVRGHLHIRGFPAPGMQLRVLLLVCFISKLLNQVTRRPRQSVKENKSSEASGGRDGSVRWYNPGLAPGSQSVPAVVSFVLLTKHLLCAPDCTSCEGCDASGPQEALDLGVRLIYVIQ